MDPITTAIVAALPVLATDLVSSSVKDAYAGLKALITRKFGATSAVSKSVGDLEADPKSQGRAIVLSEQVKEVKASSDAEILAAVNKLVDALSKAGHPTPSVHIEATVNDGVVGVAGAQNVKIGTLNQGLPPKNKG